MKKILYTLLAATTLFAVACNKEAEKNVSGDETVEASFSVGLAGSQTKAAISDGTTATQLVVGVYDRAAGFIEALSYLPTSADHKKAFDKELTAKFDARLVKGHAYDIVFLAVAPDNGIYTIDLAQKTFTASTVGTANAEVRDAFYGVYSIEKVRDAIVDQPVNLTRPFAQFNAISTKKDYEYAKSALVNFAKSAMTITAPTVMNLLDGTVGTPEKYTLSAAAMPVAQPNFDPYKTAGDYWLMFNYILAGKEKDTANLEVSLFDDKETELVTYSLPTVPIQRNYRITVYGSLLTTEGSFKVMLQPGFDGSAEFTLEHPKVTFENTALEEGKPVKVSLDAKEVNFKATHPVAGVKPTYTSSNEKVGVFDAQKEGILQLKGNGTTTVTISFPAVVDGKPVTAEEGTKADAQNENAGLNYAAFEMKFEVIVGEESVEPGTGGTDVLNLAFTGIEGTGYAEWTGKKGTSGAVYAGQSGGDKESIQLRSNNNNSGIVSTTSGGTLKKVTVTWNDETAADRELSVYGSNTAYTAATDLYGDNAGTLIGTIKKGTSTELAVTDSYKYVGLRSKSGAMYLTEIKITWEAGGETPPAPTGPSITASDITGVAAAGVTGATATVTFANAEGWTPSVTPDGTVVTAATISGTTITYTVAANEGAARNGKITVKLSKEGETDVTKEIKVAQLGVAPTTSMTIAQMKAAYPDPSAAGMNVKLGEIIVTGVDGNTVYAEDATGGVLFFKESHGMEVGKSYTGVVVTGGELYHTLYEVKSFDTSSATVATATLPLTTLTLSQITADTYLNYQSMRVKVQGVTFSAAATGGKKSVTITQSSSSLSLYIIPSVSITANSIADVVGYVSYYSSPQIAVVNASDINVTTEGTTPVETGEYASNVTWTKGTNAYDAKVLVNGATTENSALRLGKSGAYGDATLSLPAGTKTITFYGLAWKGADASVKITVGSNEYSKDLAANDGISGNNNTFTVTVTDANKYTITLPSALGSATTAKVETYSGTKTGNRAVLFGIKASK